MGTINETLREFDERFQQKVPMTAVTWQRDVDAEFVDGDTVVLPWAVAVAPKLVSDAQALETVRLKWHMDVEEMFYVGDNDVSAKGLLNGEFGNRDGKDILVDPVSFSKLAINKTLGNEKSCKWLSMIGARRFAYDKSKLRFQVRWPTLVRVNNALCYIGGIAPLAFR